MFLSAPKRSLSPVHPLGRVALASWRRHDARRGQPWWLGDELGEAPQVLGDGREGKLVLCAARAT